MSADGNLGNLLRLARNDDATVVIADENGEPQAVLLSISSYERLRNNNRFDDLTARIETLTRATDQLNKQILAAQMSDEDEFDPEEQKEESIYIEPVATE